MLLLSAQAIKAYELHGAAAMQEAANVGTMIHAFYFLQPLDLTAPEAQPVVRLLAAVPSSLRFALEHDKYHIKSIGMSHASLCASLCALVFGKEEAGEVGGGGFQFSQELMKNHLILQREMLDHEICSKFFPNKPAHWLKPLTHLCVSDANKTLLLRSPEQLLPLLLSVLALDTENVRSDMDEGARAAIQADATECLLQLAVFEPGRQILTVDEPVMHALQLIAAEGGSGGRALSAVAQESARNALSAIEGQLTELPPHEPDDDSSARHIMCSYQWDVQAVVKRVVSSLQQRQYSVWVSAVSPDLD